MPNAAAQTVVLDSTAGPVISPFLFGHNIEHTRRAMWRGLSAQLLANRKFAGESFARTPQNEPAPSRGKLSPEGVVAEWYAIGAPEAKFAHDTTTGYAGSDSQRIQILVGSGGIGQNCIALTKNGTYAFKLYAKADAATTATVRLGDDSLKKEYARTTVTVAPGDWRESSWSFTSPATDEQSSIEITFTGPATVWIGCVSLLPADHFLGMRRDVVELLKEMSTPMLRWPGGNFTLDYRWQDGLLPVDKRPTIKLGMTEVLPFTHNCDTHEIGIDEFMQLCRYLNAEPFLTANLRPDAMGTVKDATAWIQYCNGSPETEWGSVRTKRGFREPYRVKYWSIGNEIWGSHMLQAHCDAHEYARRVAVFAPAMRKADPSIILTAVGIPAPVWDAIVVAEAGQYFDYLSIHDYARPEGQDVASYKRLADNGSFEVRQKFVDCRQRIIDKSPPGAKISIAMDEWNVWHEWFAEPFSKEWHIGPTDGAFVAAVLNMVCREAEPLGISLVGYFQPINEGAIAVKPLSAELTAVGQAFKMFRAHHGQRLLKATQNTGNIDITASLSADGKRLAATIVSHDPGGDQPVTLQLPAALKATAAQVEVYSSPDTTADVPLRETVVNAVINGNAVTITAPRFGFVVVQLAVQVVS